MGQHGLIIGIISLSVALFWGWYFLGLKRSDSIFLQVISGQWLGQAALFLYFIGIPYVALSTGILRPRLFGLSGLEYFDFISWGNDFLALQIQQAATLMLLEWLLDASTTLLAGSTVVLVWVGLRLNLKRQGLEVETAQQSLQHVVYYSIHWALYRAVFWALTGDLYLAVIFGTVVVLLEQGLTQIWQGRRSVRQSFLVNAIILILTSSVFFYSPNLWLLVPVHWLMVMIANTPRIQFLRI